MVQNQKSNHSSFGFVAFNFGVQIQKESQELEIKLGVIQRPLDILAHHVAKGNEVCLTVEEGSVIMLWQAMEGARDVAVAIVKEIDELSQDITEFKIREVRHLFKEEALIVL